MRVLVVEDEPYGDWRTPDTSWWYMADPAIVAREPWYRTARGWDGDLAELGEASCTP